MNLHYLDDLRGELAKQWPSNRTVNIVCHGHSIPSGYFATPFVNTFEAYPHLLHRIIKQRFPFAVVNVIVTGIGGETSPQGSRRFETEVLNHRPDVVTIDYGLNDRGVGLEAAEAAWRSMIEAALRAGRKVILLTPTWDCSYLQQDAEWKALQAHTRQIRALAQEYQVGLADSFAAFERSISSPEQLPEFLSHVNHPSRKGHELAAQEIARYFLAK